MMSIAADNENNEKAGIYVGPGTEGAEALIGHVIAGYRLERVLGKGMSGAVYLGRRIAEESAEGPVSPDGPDQVAIKVLLLPWQMEADERAIFRSRFEREVNALQRMRHPNIVPVLGSGEQDGLPYMIQSYLPGDTLAKRLAKDRCPLPEANRYLTQLAAALDHAHSLGIIHRDIKPQNVLLDGEGNAHLSDFSVARLLEETQTKLTSSSLSVGSPAYVAPEQIDDSKVGPLSDIYSLGVLLFELVTGQTPFEADTLREMLRKQSQELPPLPRSLRPDLPEPAEAVIWQALAKQPEARFASATEMAHAFSEGLNGQWDATVRPIILPPSQPGSLQWSTTFKPGMRSSQGATPPPASPWWRRSLVPALLAVIVLMLISALVLSHNGLGALLSPSSTPGAQNAGLGGSTATAGNNTPAPTATPKRHTSGGGSGGTGGTGGKPAATATATPTPTPRPTATPKPAPTATPKPTKKITIGWSSAHSPWIWIKYSGFSNGTYQWSCNFTNSSGGDLTIYTYNISITANPMTVDNGQTCWDQNHGEHVWVSVGSVVSNKLTVP